MNIGEVARLSGLSCKAIRLYEQKGLFSSPLRSANGYRDYRQQHVDQLRLIKQAKAAGFSLEECGELISLYNDPKRRSADIKAKARQKVAQLDQQLIELQAMRNKLASLVARCPGDDQAQCPIIMDFATGMTQPLPAANKSVE